MLVLSRRVHERITLKVTKTSLAKLAAAGQGLEIEVTTVRIQPDKVRLGFTAIDAVEILRTELLKAA